MVGHWGLQSSVQGPTFDSKCVFFFCLQQQAITPAFPHQAKAKASILYSPKMHPTYFMFCFCQATGQLQNVAKTVVKRRLQARVHVIVFCFSFICTMQHPRVRSPQPAQPEPAEEYVMVEEVPLWIQYHCPMCLLFISPCQQEQTQILFDITKGMSASPTASQEVPLQVDMPPDGAQHTTRTAPARPTPTQGTRPPNLANASPPWRLSMPPPAPPSRPTQTQLPGPYMMPRPKHAPCLPKTTVSPPPSQVRPRIGPPKPTAPVQTRQWNPHQPNARPRETQGWGNRWLMLATMVHLHRYEEAHEHIARYAPKWGQRWDSHVSQVRQYGYDHAMWKPLGLTLQATAVKKIVFQCDAKHSYAHALFVASFIHHYFHADVSIYNN